jgi:HEAT repeat protein
VSDVPDQSPLTAAVAQLAAKTSPNRRAAAKRLRRLKDPTAGPALLATLQREVQDPRTWETQYQLIMALGESSYRPALPYLRQLASQPFDATMIYVALGDAIVRLGRDFPEDGAPVLDVMQTGNPMLIDGAFRAVAMLRLRLNEEAIGRILDYVSALPAEHYLRFWVAAAAPGWEHPKLPAFLETCAGGPRDDVRTAALAAQQKKYLTWRPL